MDLMSSEYGIVLRVFHSDGMPISDLFTDSPLSFYEAYGCVCPDFGETDGHGDLKRASVSGVRSLLEWAAWAPGPLCPGLAAVLHCA